MWLQDSGVVSIFMVGGKEDLSVITTKEGIRIAVNL